MAQERLEKANWRRILIEGSRQWGHEQAQRWNSIFRNRHEVAEDEKIQSGAFMASERGKLDPEIGGQLRVEFEFEKTGRGNSQWKNVRDIPKKSLMVLKSERESSSGQEA